VYPFTRVIFLEKKEKNKKRWQEEALTKRNVRISR
jgi:hypothetical protein